jgi:hypothetical protein
MPLNFVACREKVLNRGRAPVAFLNELVDWGIAAPDEIFSKNDQSDVYSLVLEALGPWENDLHRRAVMLEVLRVLGGFESAWDWNAGRDVTNPHSNTACTEEAGIFQCSGNSMSFDASLKSLFQAVSGATERHVSGNDQSQPHFRNRVLCPLAAVHREPSRSAQT